MSQKTIFGKALKTKYNLPGAVYAHKDGNYYEPQRVWPLVLAEPSGYVWFKDEQALTDAGLTIRDKTYGYRIYVSGGISGLKGYIKFEDRDLQGDVLNDQEMESKYPGGEGADHLALKKWIAANPALIGIPGAAKVSEEHRFLSADHVDIAFHHNHEWWVVEIETTEQLPGAYQVIKYRALAAAAQSWALHPERVIGILAAWEFDQNTLDFCKRYQIQAWQCRTGDMTALRKA